MCPPQISVVTSVLNRRSTVGDALGSVLGQSLPSVESVVIDGGSNDGTLDVLDDLKDRIDVCVSEPDEGIYDALNKGIRYCNGSIIGFLHADDLLADEDVLNDVALEFERSGADAVFGSLLYVDQADLSRTRRYWRERRFDPQKFRSGWMPPHPTVYIRREIYEKFGGFRTDFQISADYELMLRLMFKHRIRVSCVPKILVKMRVGGKSNASLANRRLANSEDYKAWVVNGLKPPPLLRFRKPLCKIPQFWRRPK